MHSRDGHNDSSRNRPTRVEVVTTREVTERAEVVTFITHHPDGLRCEGDTDLTESNAASASMATLIGHDPALREVAALPVGWSALRFDSQWNILPPDDITTASKPAKGFLVHFDQAATSGHRACGEHGIDGAHCPNCDKPMLRMLSLDTADDRLELSRLGVPFVHLVFCWTCNLAHGRTSYRLLPAGGIELLQYRRGGVEDDFPYRDYPRFFAATNVHIEPVPESEAQVIAALNDDSTKSFDLPDEQQHLATPRHQVGGAPFFVQGVPTELCPECSMPMTFLACVADGATNGESYTGNEFVQTLFMLCERDRVVASFQVCD